MPRRKSTTPERDPLPQDAPPAQEPEIQTRRPVPPFGTCRPDTVSFELYRVTTDDEGREHHELITSVGEGPAGTDRREWPIQDISADLLAPHGPGIYRARFYGRRPDGARYPLGMSQKVTRSAAGAAAATPRAEPPRPAPHAALDVSAIVAAAEARAEARARSMLDFVMQQSAQKEKQQSDFFAAMMELQTRAHAQQMEAMQRARAPMIAPAVSPELVRIQTELAVMKDRQRRGRPDDEDDEDDDPAMRLLSSPVVAEIARALASKFLDAPASAPATAQAQPHATPPSDAREGDDDDPA